jgi:hypothetical protein
LALIGMIEKFDSRNLIGSFLTLGNLLMALAAAADRLPGHQAAAGRRAARDGGAAGRPWPPG